MYDIEAFKRIYPEWFRAPTLLDIISVVFFLSLPFLIPYLYIICCESRAVSFVRDRLIPFIRFRLHLEKVITLIKRMLELRIFVVPRARL
jgi:hypothetical protein